MYPTDTKGMKNMQKLVLIIIYVAKIREIKISNLINSVSIIYELSRVLSMYVRSNLMICILN